MMLLLFRPFRIGDDAEAVKQRVLDHASALLAAA
ncbi:hypothetical protein ABIF65_003450 [Bradyrhizobium japonicum]|nr:hypothetical protein [Bradyrhizobium japonicum]MCP1859127.1 hypothetical protein [Bradyrhizobium japonicum]MCP1889942.1 hypothetical protein [Bradyrhizobium japonicum]MCP1957244.1 hypothetical protein [Bradyrhizobium japonicum]MCW2322925.1 hypothetical protein [Bradyrhizobium japonicum]